MNHFDDIILNYKEGEMNCIEDEEVGEVIKRVCSFIDGSLDWLNPHAILLRGGEKERGEIKPHVDSIKFSGGIVAGLSLNSSRVLRLRPEVEDVGNKGYFVDLFAEKNSLYILCDEARYSYTHEIVKDESGTPWDSELEGELCRDRFSVIFRDCKKKTDCEPN